VEGPISNFAPGYFGQIHPSTNPHFDFFTGSKAGIQGFNPTALFVRQTLMKYTRYWAFLLGFALAFSGDAQAGAHYPAAATSEISATQELEFLTNIRQVTFQGRRAGEGYFNRDGTKMVFQSERELGNPFYQIYLTDFLSGETSRISPGVGKTTCAWIHPTEEKILFASTHEDAAAKNKQEEEFQLRDSGKERRYSWDYDETYDLFESDFQGKGLMNLTQTRGYDAEGSWSPDGKTIAFASNRHAYSQPLSPTEEARFAVDLSYFMEIYLMDADGKSLRRLTEAPGYDGGPFFSADGRKICWRRFSEDGNTAEVWTMNADGSDQRQITHLGAMSWAPYYHPSGDYLIFTTNLHGFGNFELYLVAAQGKSTPVRVTYTDDFDGLPVFTPDGNGLAWTSKRTPDKTSQIFLADWNDGRARELLGVPPSDWKAEVVSQTQAVSARTLDDSLARIDEQDLRSHVEFLASEELEGRLTGTVGEKLATKYVESAFKSLGFEPAGESGTYFQEFEFNAGVSLGEGNRLAIQMPDSADKSTTFETDKDWRPLAFSRTGEIEPAEIVFAGYGIVAPGEEGAEGYDSFVHLDVEDKWVLVFRFMPEGLDAEGRRRLLRFSSPRYKSMVLRGKGAKGVLFASGPTSKVKDPLMKLVPDASLAGSGIAALSVSDEAAQTILDYAGKNLAELQTELDSGQAALGFAIPGVELAANIDIKSETRTGRNVLARLPAPGSATRETIAIGAHIDHLGRGYGTNSLAKESEEGKVHYGADDNASGVAGLLEMAETLVSVFQRSPESQRRDLLFAAWSGEEMGLLGSTHFTNRLAKEVLDSTSLYPHVAAYLNMDMIGRFDRSLILQGYGSSGLWPALLEECNTPIGLPITTADDSYLPTDSTQFYLKGVPILSAFTGSHEDYHSPRDTPDKIDYANELKIVQLLTRVAHRLATREGIPDYVEMKKPENLERRAYLRAYLGTIPDYSQSSEPGVKLSGVAKDGPADKAGVKGGDVIVELAGQKIENIYDYTYAIEALKVGEPSAIAVKRGGEEVRLEVIPGSRE